MRLAEEWPIWSSCSGPSLLYNIFPLALPKCRVFQRPMFLVSPLLPLFLPCPRKVRHFLFCFWENYYVIVVNNFSFWGAVTSWDWLLSLSASPSELIQNPHNASSVWEFFTFWKHICMFSPELIYSKTNTSSLKQSSYKEISQRSLFR